jgi:3',5'-cyclic AMP phosphodiesterase CpdA
MNRRKFIKTLAISGAAMSSMSVLGETFIPFAKAADIPKFSFAHITDLHLDVRGTSTWQHREKSVLLFIDTLRQIGKLHKLKFVIFGGDQVHAGPRDRESLSVFQAWTRHLDLPYYILLGNTEVSPVPGVSTMTKEAFLMAWRGRGVAPGRSSWSVEPEKGVRIIGFDVTLDGKTHGEASPASLSWLGGELAASARSRLVIVVTHQLLLPTNKGDSGPEGALWMVKNHVAVRDILEKYPNVRMVISGHHHASRVETVNNITYVADPAIVTYPCAFRVFTVSRDGIHLRNVGLDEKNIVNKARELLLADPYARLYDPDNPQNILTFNVGLTEQDRETTIPL